MSESEGGVGRFVRRLVDGIEDSAENAIQAATRAADAVEDAVERRFRRGEQQSHAAKVTHHHGESTTVNVHVDCGCHCCGPDTKPGRAGAGGAGAGSGRPGHITGTSDGSLPNGQVGVGGILGTVTRPGDVWPGSRTQLFLPFLFLRANAGDTGARPVLGPFWESPDILIAAGVDPANAPAVPDQLGAVAEAGADNTVYAHVWNLGQAPSPDTLVEFYWFNPALGFSGDQAHFIGATWIDLGARGESTSHKLVRCPVSWRAQYLNGGHECLVVRTSQTVLDPLSGPAWDASRNRHVGQRNIHVMSAGEAAAKPTLPMAVGPVFGGITDVAVARADTASMQWLHLLTMDRNAVPATGAATGDVGLTAPTPAGAPLPNLGAMTDPRGAGLIGDGHTVGADGQQVGFHATDSNPGAGNAHVYRVTSSQQGSLLGGYTVVVLGD